MKLLSAHEIKHYLYISNPKVTLLYEQIASSEKITTSIDWGIDLHAFKFSRKKERESEISLQDKLKTVIKTLEDMNLVGTIDAPRDYFKGVLPMKWGTLRDWGRPDDESPLIYFGGKTENTMFGLGGSSKHIIGNDGCASTDSRSAAPAIIREILNGLNNSKEGWGTVPKDDNHTTCEAIKWANRNLGWAQEQTIDFYAKTLLTDNYNDSDGKRLKVVLGSPIYAVLKEPSMNFSYYESIED